MPYLQTSLALLFVLVVMGLVYWVLQRSGLLYGIQKRNRRTEIVERIPAGEKASILLIRVDNRNYLVGSAPQRISLLTEIEPVLAPAQVPAEPEGMQPTVFERCLQRFQ